jgi:DNA polymerase/3'-5' exonuclease PolX
LLPPNEEVADVLDRMGELLVQNGEPNPYRVQAYVQAARMVRAHDAPLASLYAEGGKDALMDLPGIGPSLAEHVARYVETGRIGLKDRLEAATDPAELFESVPGVGPALAQQLVGDLGLRTLAALERACYDGRVEALPGMGPRKTEGLRLQLNALIGRESRRRLRRVRRSVLKLEAARRRAAEQEPAPLRLVEVSENQTDLFGDGSPDPEPPTPAAPALRLAA